MPFIDLNSNAIDFDAASFDVVIVGAGAAGILLAVELSKKKKKVLLLESGHFEEDSQRQALNEVVQTGKNLSNSVWGRKRAIGGTTIAWGGQSLPYGRLDFANRDWLQYSGWPLPYETLATEYKMANKFMGIDELDYEDDIFRLLKMKRAGFNEALIHHHFAKWAPEPNFRKIYNDHLLQHTTLVYNAVLAKIEPGADGRIVSVTVNNFKGESFSIGVSRLILAAGTIETIRILLNQEMHTAGGMGNHSGWLGKNFMDHPCIEAGVVETRDRWKLQAGFNTHFRGNRKYSIRMSMAEAYQKEQRLLNGSASLFFAYDAEDTDPYEKIRELIRTKKMPAMALPSMSDINSYLLSTVAYAFPRFIYKHKARIKLIMMMEQEPTPDSYIGLSDEKDIHGTRRALIHWKITHKTWDSVLHLSHAVSGELQRLSLGTVKLHDHIRAENPDWESHLADVCHHMGGTRMSATPAEGVVDTDLKVWGHDNLYVCSASVFPTTSHSNPTLTLLALAERLAGQL